jgi:hypothetical protein
MPFKIAQKIVTNFFLGWSTISWGPAREPWFPLNLQFAFSHLDPVPSFVLKRAMWVESILLCRNHYRAPVPSVVLKGASQSSYAGTTTMHLLVKTNNL